MASEKVLDELCNDTDCGVSGTHWHPFTVESMLAEPVGEYTITVRVRSRRKKRKDDCSLCGQLMLPAGVMKRPNEYDHASGCPKAPKRKRAARKGKR